MLELWVMVIGGEDDDERVVATGGFEEIEEAIDQYEPEIYNGHNKYFSLVDMKDGEERSFECHEQYYEDIKPDFEEKYSLARLLGERLLMKR